MEMASCAAPILVEDSYLESWTKIGSGGFGHIYKARHKRLCCDVAIKLLHYDDRNGSSLLHELDMMRQGSSPYVIQVLGVFRGLPPVGSVARLGLVMEFMERGCLGTLQESLCGAPPWPLVFRLAHQVALGINFLHNLSPPLLHLDLKPSNVLLDSYLKAKLTDFGLAKVYHSVSRASCKKDSDTEAGTLSYMPPEAFDLCYSPTKASDIYSFGILLWSIVTGKQPYQHALSTIVRLRIPQGDRPSLEDIRVQAAGIAGLTGLMDLMIKCWEMKPSERPSSHNCTLATEELFKLHKHNINSAVLQVLQKLDQTPTERLTDQFLRVHVSRSTANAANGCFNVPTGKGPVQEVSGHCTTNQDQARLRDNSVPFPVRVSEADLHRSPSSPKLRSSSVKPIAACLPPPSPSASPNTKHRRPQAALLPNRHSQYQRQFSSPGTLPNHQQQQQQQPPPARHINITCSNVTGLQWGDSNVMHIQGLAHFERKRHPTAPSRVDLPPQRKGSGKDKKGGVG